MNIFVTYQWIQLIHFRFNDYWLSRNKFPRSFKLAQFHNQRWFSALKSNPHLLWWSIHWRDIYKHLQERKDLNVCLFENMYLGSFVLSWEALCILLLLCDFIAHLFLINVTTVLVCSSHVLVPPPHITIVSIILCTAIYSTIWRVFTVHLIPLLQCYSLYVQ